MSEPLCSDCQPADYPTDKTRCDGCPRRKRRKRMPKVCVGAHDRCYGGAAGPCPYCEPATAKIGRRMRP